MELKVRVAKRQPRNLNGLERICKDVCKTGGLLQETSDLCDCQQGFCSTKYEVMFCEGVKYLFHSLKYKSIYNWWDCFVILSLTVKNKPTIKIIDWSFLCQWANIQMQCIYDSIRSRFWSFTLCDYHWRERAPICLRYRASVGNFAKPVGE